MGKYDSIFNEIENEDINTQIPESKYANIFNEIEQPSISTEQPRPEENQPNPTWEGVKGFGQAIAESPIGKAFNVLDYPARKAGELATEYIGKPVGNLISKTVTPVLESVNKLYDRPEDVPMSLRVAQNLPESVAPEMVGQGVRTLADIATGKGLVKGVEKTIKGVTKAGKAVKNFISPSAEYIANDRYKALSNLERNYTDLKKINSKAVERNFDPKKIISETDLLEGVVGKDGKIDTRMAVQKFNDQIKPYEDVINKNLKSEAIKLNFNEFASDLKNKIKNSCLTGENKELAYNKLRKEIKGLRDEIDSYGFIDLSKIHQAKVNKYSNIDYSNPITGKADKVIAKGLKQIVEENINDLNVKKLNDELGKFYTVQNYIEKLGSGGKVVEGGRLGKYFAKTIGGIAGSHFGPFGTIVGSELGGALKGLQMSRTFGVGGEGLKFSEDLKKASSGFDYQPNFTMRDPNRGSLVPSSGNLPKDIPYEPNFTMKEPDVVDVNYTPSNLLPKRQNLQITQKHLKEGKGFTMVKEGKPPFQDIKVIKDIIKSEPTPKQSNDFMKVWNHSSENARTSIIDRIAKEVKVKEETIYRKIAEIERESRKYIKGGY
jgi:hypothetical protein